MSIVIYEHVGFKGRTLILTSSLPDFHTEGFNDIASSIRVESGTWVLYQHTNYEGLSYQVGPGQYDMDEIKRGIGNDVISSAKLASDHITLCEHVNYGGQLLPLTMSVPSLVDLGFNDKVSSVKVAAGTWRLYEHVNYQGRFMEVGPGNRNLSEIAAKIGNDHVSSVKLAQAEIVLYEHAGFKGKAVPLTSSTENLTALGFNDKTSSIRVVSGTWIVYEHSRYGGNSLQLTPGAYSFETIKSKIGNDVISSVKLVSY